MQYKPEQLRNVIRVPAGRCPIGFGHICTFVKSYGCRPSPTTIIVWFWEVRELGLARGQFLTAEAIAYYARYDYNPNSYDYKMIEKEIYEYARNINDPFAPPEKEGEQQD